MGLGIRLICDAPGCDAWVATVISRGGVLVLPRPWIAMAFKPAAGGSDDVVVACSAGHFLAVQKACPGLAGVAPGAVDAG